jgi:hypothetical protein
MSVLSPTLKLAFEDPLEPEVVVADVVVVLAEFFDPQPAATTASATARNMRGSNLFTGPPRF